MTADRGPKRRPQTFGGVIYLIVLGLAGAGLAFTALGPWRTGVGWMGVGMLLGALARAVLSERGAGMLRVRRKIPDVLMLVVAGAALLVLAVVIPDQPPVH